MTSAPARPDPLIAVAELSRTLTDVTLLDVRWRFRGPVGLAEYGAGHVPGAAYVDLDTELCAPADARGRRPVPSPEAFTAAMREHGVRPDRPVVVYDADDSSAAARGWWLLRYFGHQDVRVLDGGYAAWLAAGLPVESGPPERRRGTFVAVPGSMPTLDAEGAARTARTGVLLDVRPAERYRGEGDHAKEVPGHIPGAVSAPALDNVTADGRFRAASDLRGRFGGLGTAPVGAYCGSGILAAHAVLALRVAGIDAALYTGSWSQWTMDPARPVALGPGTG
ncbi:sulfurtransferase [Actinoallomurus vinaceus]|uniref:Sulfurtransferase n=1 Tax=Actinoallomurus vinaceus TaxID=1080074 RepID=A0ABP8UVB1_9ACTN